jgi:hypothetical protein
MKKSVYTTGIRFGIDKILFAIMDALFRHPYPSSMAAAAENEL